MFLWRWLQVFVRYILTKLLPGNDSDTTQMIGNRNTNISNNIFNNSSVHVGISSAAKKNRLEEVCEALRDDNWKAFEDQGKGYRLVFYNDNYPLVRFEECISEEGAPDIYHAYWVPKGLDIPRRTTKMFIRLLHDGNAYPISEGMTRISSVYIDDGRSHIVAPRQYCYWLIPDKRGVMFYYYVNNSIEFLFDRVLRKICAQDPGRPYKFPVFNDEELAKAEFIRDIEQGTQKYKSYEIGN